MTSKMNTKVRRVRCPRCMNVLQEPVGVPVYKCGGCGTALQAKKPKNATVDTTSQRLEEDSLGKRKMEQVSDDGEPSSSSNQQSLVNSIDEPDRNNDHNEPCSSTELSCHEDLESSLEATAHNRMNQVQDADKKAKIGIVDAPSGEAGENSSGKRKMVQLSDDQEAGSSSKQPSLVNSIDKPDQNSDLHSLTKLSGHEDPESLPEATAHNRMDQDQDEDHYQDAARNQKNVAVDATSGGLEHSSGKQKMEQLSDDQEASSSSNQQSLVNSIHKPDQSSDLHSSTELSGHEDPESSPEATAHNRMDQDQDAAKHQKNVTVDATSGGIEHSSGKQKMEQLSDDQEAGSSLNQQPLVNSINEPDQNSDYYEPRSSSELSYHEDPESSPETTVHNRINQEHHHHHHQEQGMFMINEVLENCKIGAEFEESSREFTASREKYSFSELNEIEESSREAIANMMIVKDSDGRSKSNFKSLIAEKLLDTRQRKPVYLDEDDTLSEDGSADLCHRRRFERISSVETMENTRVGGTSNYGYEGSVSSFDGNDNQVPGKNRIGLRGDEHVDSGNGYHNKRRHEFHRSNGRWGKDEHRSTGVRSFYGNSSPSKLGFNEFHENPRHRSPVIPENEKMERLELLKMVRELQNQLERTNISNAARQVPSYYSHILDHPRRYGQRMAFSGEAAVVNRSRDGCPCYHCCPQDRHFSAQLPQKLVCCNGPHYVPSAYYSSHCSGPSSPQHHSGSEFSVLSQNKPERDDHRHRNDVPKPYRSPKKRFVRSIAGGAPLVTCYRCSKLLQLPQSFLVFKRRYHSLRCGACLKVLNFTLSNGTHVNRYHPEETIHAPPSSEVEDYADLTASRAGPVSCSDCSFQKSYSTETDRNGSRELIEERRKATLVKDPSDSAWRSSKILGRKKMTSEIEEIEPVASGSPLHRLMGYASPSKVIRGW